MDKDAAVIKALAELGLHKDQPSSVQIKAIEVQLDKYQREIGKLNARDLKKYLLSTLD